MSPFRRPATPVFDHATDAAVVRLEGVRKSFGEREVLRGIDLEVGEHEVVALNGASGSGK